MNYDSDHGIDRENEESMRRSRRLSDYVHRILQSIGVMESPLPEGVRQEFIDSLDRVPKPELKPEDECPICHAPFLEDPYPLVVQLNCPGRHRFDLECVSKWLKHSGTCPMCRHDFTAGRSAHHSQLNEGDEEEEEYDDMYA